MASSTYPPLASSYPAELGFIADSNHARAAYRCRGMHLCYFERLPISAQLFCTKLRTNEVADGGC